MKSKLRINSYKTSRSKETTSCITNQDNHFGPQETCLSLCPTPAILQTLRARCPSRASWWPSYRLQISDSLWLFYHSNTDCETQHGAWMKAATGMQGSSNVGWKTTGYLGGMQHTCLPRPGRPTLRVGLT